MNKNTKTKIIDGATFNGDKIYRQKITVRYTDDEIGKTLSLQAQDFMILVPFEEVEKIIKSKEN